jgi:AraC-like DNA-binding protein
MNNEFEVINSERGDNITFLLNSISHRQPHLHFDIEIIFVISGHTTVRTNQTDYLIKEGQAIMLNSCQVHELFSENAALCLILQFNAANFALLYPQLENIQFDSEPFVITKALLSLLLKAAYSYFEEQDVVSLRTAGYTSLILYEVLKSSTFNCLTTKQHDRKLELQERIERISSLIHENFQRKISLAELAESEGISRTYFSHFFRNQFGCSFQQYLDRIRAEYGRRLLQTTSDNFLTISYLCGFADIRTFNNAFIRNYGISLREFREGKSLEPLINEHFEEDRELDLQTIYDNTESLQILKEHFGKSFVA